MLWIIILRKWIILENQYIMCRIFILHVHKKGGVKHGQGDNRN
jgi:hypothetical protein